MLPVVVHLNSKSRPQPSLPYPANSGDSNFDSHLWLFECMSLILGASQVALEVGDLGSIPGWGRSPGGGPLQYSCLESPMDRGAGWLWSIGSQRIRHDWSDLAHTGTHYGLQIPERHISSSPIRLTRFVGWWGQEVLGVSVFVEPSGKASMIWLCKDNLL